MGKRAAGICLCGISAFLFSTRYICAAIYGSGIALDGGYGSDVFQKWLDFIGTPLNFWSLIALIAGVIYLILGEYDSLNKHK